MQPTIACSSVLSPEWLVIIYLRAREDPSRSAQCWTACVARLGEAHNARRSRLVSTRVAVAVWWESDSEIRRFGDVLRHQR